MNKGGKSGLNSGQNRAKVSPGKWSNQIHQNITNCHFSNITQSSGLRDFELRPKMKIIMKRRE